MKQSLVILLVLICFRNVYAQSEPKEVISKFFNLYNEDNSDQAIDYLFSNSPYVKDIEEGIGDVKRQLKKQIILIGKYHGKDLLTSKTVGPNIIMYTYLVRHNREPLIFYIMFYKPNNKWQLQSFKYHNSISDELEEASKVFRLNENF